MFIDIRICDQIDQIANAIRVKLKYFNFTNCRKRLWQCFETKRFEIYLLS